MDPRITSDLADDSTKRVAGQRRLARTMALQMLFQYDLVGGEALALLEGYDPLAYAPQESANVVGLNRALTYARQLFEGVVGNLERIDSEIAARSVNWRLERMPAIDRNALRLAVYEMIFQSDVPGAVVIDEAIELVKRYGTADSGAFVNGLLDRFLRDRGSVRSVGGA